MRVVAEMPDFLMLFSYIRDTWATLTNSILLEHRYRKTSPDLYVAGLFFDREDDLNNVRYDRDVAFNALPGALEFAAYRGPRDLR